LTLGFPGSYRSPGKRLPGARTGNSLSRSWRAPISRYASRHDGVRTLPGRHRWSMGSAEKLISRRRSLEDHRDDLDDCRFLAKVARWWMTEPHCTLLSWRFRHENGSLGDILRVIFVETEAAVKINWQPTGPKMAPALALPREQRPSLRVGI
jgi:hypothetical protein